MLCEEQVSDCLRNRNFDSMLFSNIVHCGKSRQFSLISAGCNFPGRAAALQAASVCLQITVKKLFDLLTAGKFQFIGLRPVRKVKDCSKVFFLLLRSNT